MARLEILRDVSWNYILSNLVIQKTKLQKNGRLWKVLLTEPIRVYRAFQCLGNLILDPWQNSVKHIHLLCSAFCSCWRNQLLNFQLIDVYQLIWNSTRNIKVNKLWTFDLPFQKFELHLDKHDYTVNFDIFMNPSPVRVGEVAPKNIFFNIKVFNIQCLLFWQDDSVARIFQTFRALGLRHMIVVDNENRVRGMLTRVDFIFKED